MSYTYNYEMPAVTVDAMVVRQRPAGIGEWENQILLIKRGREGEPYYGHWAFPGGYVEKYEEPVDACVRELREETGIVLCQKPGLFHVAGGEGRDPRGWVIALAFWIIVPWDTPVKADDDAKEFGWFDLNDPPKMAFDHRRTIEKYWAIKPYLTRLEGMVEGA